MKEIIKKINEYDQIMLFRHVNPDYDAFGSQLGFYYFLKENFKDKNIVLCGDFTSDLTDLYIKRPLQLEVDEGKTLGIVLDTANNERIDGDISQCDEVIKIDHHIVVDSYGSFNYEDPSASSTCQMVTQLYSEVEDEYTLNKEAASCLYMGIIGDSNRFMYRSTDRRTFACASLLIDKGIEIEKIYQSMYLRHEKDLQINKFILNNYQVNNEIAYFILRQEDLDELQISREQGSNYVNVLSNIEEFKIWIAITENVVDGNFRVSIRSRETTINDVAAMFNGGGHALASGATLQSLEQLPQLLSELSKKLKGE